VTRSIPLPGPDGPVTLYQQALSRARLIGIARAKGASAFAGDGSNRWPAVHRLDAARLFRLAVEAAPAGSRLHGAGEEGIPFRDIAEATGRQLNLPAVSVAAEDAAGHFGFLSGFVPVDNLTSSALTRERLGWRPEGPGLIADIERVTTSVTRRAGRGAGRSSCPGSCRWNGKPGCPR